MHALLSKMPWLLTTAGCVPFLCTNRPFGRFRIGGFARRFRLLVRVCLLLQAPQPTSQHKEIRAFRRP